MKPVFTSFKLAGICFLFFLFSFAQSINAQVFTTATQTQDATVISTTTCPFGIGTTNQRLLRIDLTAVAGSPIDVLTQLNFTVTGYAEISKITVLVGNSTTNAETTDLNSLTTSKNFGSISDPQASVSIPGNFTLVTGKNTLVVLVDVKPNAVIGNNIDIVCTDLIVSTATKTITAPAVDNNAIVSANISGTKTIKGTGGDYTSILKAFADINNKGIGGPITLVLDDDATYAEAAGDFLLIYSTYLRQSPTALMPLTIKRSNTGTNPPTITCSTLQLGKNFAFMGFYGVDYVTIDGLNFIATASSTIPFYNAVHFKGNSIHGCSNNTVKNCNFNLNNQDLSQTTAIRFENYANSTTTSNNYNKIFNNAFSNVDAAVNFNYNLIPLPASTLYNDQGNEIYSNTITGKFGYSYGAISVNYCKDTKIYNNTLDGTGSSSNINNYARGINTPFDGANVSSCTGYIYCYGNIIKNFSNANTGNKTAIVGIQLSAPIVQIYNNFVANLKAESSTNPNTNIAGIQVPSSGPANPYHYLWNNSVNINQVTPGTAKTAALVLADGKAMSLNLINNIFVNTSTGSVNNYVVYSGTITKSVLDATSDNNLYYPVATNFIYYSSTGAYSTLDLYKAALLSVSTEQNAVSAIPPFVSASNLHLTTLSTIIHNGGKPVDMVTTDIDGEPRNATAPDLGADEIVLLPTNVSTTSTDVFDTHVYSRIGQIVVDLSKVNSASVVSIIDVKGSVIKTLFSKGSELLNIDIANKGLYLVRIQNGDKLSTQKIVLF